MHAEVAGALRAHPDAKRNPKVIGQMLEVVSNRDAFIREVPGPYDM